LLITGFSIFLLATSLEQYDSFESAFRFNKLSGQRDNPIFAISIRLIISTIPLALRFFLISLLVNLLLRGFWIGIVGLSSVSNQIDFDHIKLQKPFKKFLPENVRTLDELILFLDKISSVIFAYTYLVAFSLISVVLIGAFLFSIIGITVLLPRVFGDTAVVALMNFVLFMTWLVFALAALIFFLDTLLFSAFKKSKWFSILYYPIYRFYGVISISFLYRSIYYHLITNFKKKQIAMVSLGLLVISLVVNRIEAINPYQFYPEIKEELSNVVQNKHYDDQRSFGYINTVSMPSKYVKSRYLEFFVRYNPNLNSAFELLCPEAKDLEVDESFIKSINAGIESQLDTSKRVKELIYPIDQYRKDVEAGLDCITQVYEFYVDGSPLLAYDLIFTQHQNKGEKGFLVIVNIDEIPAGRHELEVKVLAFKDSNIFNATTLDDFEMETWVRIPFWKE